MYWTDWGSHPKIERAEMTGKQRIVLVGSGLGWPNGLTVDRGKHRLYWVDAENDKLEYLDMNSNNRVTLIQSSVSLYHPFGLTLLDDHLYWTDWYWETVFRANKTGGGVVAILKTGLGQPMDIHGYNLSEHTSQGNSSCQANNGGCSHLCLLSSTGNECACPKFYSLKQDNKTCYFTSSSTSTSVAPSTSPSVSPSSSLAVSQSTTPTVSTSTSPSVSLSVVTSKAAVASVSTLALTSPLVLVSTLTATPSLLTSISVAASSLAPVSAATFLLAVTSILPPPVTEAATKPSSTLCRPGTCRNGGNCSIPGFVCRCKKTFAWHDCSVFVGFSAVEIIFTLPGENQWNEFKFKVALSKACTMFFCRNDKCTSKSTKFRKVKRSDEATYFQPSDVIIIAFSFTAKTTLKVEFAVLLPSVEGQPPQVTPPEDVVLMVDETKQSIQNDLGGTIESVSVKEGNKEPGIGGESPRQKRSSVAPIATGVGVGVVVVSALVAFALYRLIRRVRKLDSERNDADQLELRFQNPAYQAEPIYDSISSATGRSVVQNLSRGTEEIPSTNLSRMYDPPKPRHASPTGKTPDYACLHRTAPPGQGSSESEKNKGNYANDDEHYMKLTNYMTAYESSNLPDEGDYLEPVDGHDRNAQRSGRGKENGQGKNGKLH